MIQRVTVTWAPGQAVVDVIGTSQHDLTEQELGRVYWFVRQLWEAAETDAVARQAAELVREAIGQNGHQEAR